MRFRNAFLFLTLAIAAQSAKAQLVLTVDLGDTESLKMGSPGSLGHPLWPNIVLSCKSSSHFTDSIKVSLNTYGKGTVLGKFGQPVAFPLEFTLTQTFFGINFFFDVRFPTDPGIFTGNVTITQIDHVPGASPCPGSGPPLSASALFSGTVESGIVGINDVLLIDQPSPFIFSNATGLAPIVNCGKPFCPVFYSAGFYAYPPSHAFIKQWTWHVDLYHLFGTYSLSKLVSLGSSVGITTPFPLPPTNKWLRDTNGNILAKVWVDAIDSDGFSHHAEKLVGIKAPPEKPFLTSDRLTGTQVQLTYGAGGATSYSILYGPLSGGPYNGMGAAQGNSPLPATTQTTFTVSGLRPFRPYYFTVVASNAQGVSMLSNQVALNLNTQLPNLTNHLDPMPFSPGCLSPFDNLVLWLSFDEPAGPTVANIAPEAQQGVRVGSPSPSPGKVSRALCFDGVADYVEVPSYPAIDFGVGDFSVAAWVKRSANDRQILVLVDKRDELSGFSASSGLEPLRQDLQAPVAGFSVFLFQGALWFQLADGAYANFNSTAKVPADGEWHHIAVTVLRSSATGGQFYLDGQPVGRVFDPTPFRHSLTATHPLRVGSRSSSVSGLFNGCLDEVQIFSRSLQPSEVLNLYHSQRAGMCK